MVDLFKTRLGETLNRTRLLSDRVAWFEAFDTILKVKILDWVRYEQLAKGVDENDQIMGLYSEFTEMINPEKQAGTPYTLYDTGDFYRSLFMVILLDSFIIDGDDEKIDEFGNITRLFNWLGNGIVGLNEKSRQKLKNEIIIKFNKYVRKILQIN
jgi:hypothetical protein